MNEQMEIGNVDAAFAETPERFERLLPKENTVRVRNLIKRYEMGHRPSMHSAVSISKSSAANTSLSWGHPVQENRRSSI